VFHKKILVFFYPGFSLTCVRRIGYEKFFNFYLGVVTNGGARDTDEIIKVKKIPVYCKNGYSTRGVRPGRLIAESYNFFINCAGVLVFPGDLIVADGDGVIVVPREHALTVGKLARQINSGDEKSRTGRYKRLGIKSDQTVIVE
jgi:4-hydroxy-4-methyl-2-oxoglutarate aldolase